LNSGEEQVTIQSVEHAIRGFRGSASRQAGEIIVSMRPNYTRDQGLVKGRKKKEQGRG